MKSFERVMTYAVCLTLICVLVAAFSEYDSQRARANDPTSMPKFKILVLDVHRGYNEASPSVEGYTLRYTHADYTWVMLIYELNAPESK